MYAHDESRWTPELLSRWRAIAAHPFECGTAPLDFCARLAREQRWTRSQARAAIDEYRRFCFLAAMADEVVVPSAAVDQVWHLHLTYTRDYWQTFCPKVLGCDLHHEPGGQQASDLAYYRARYAETLALYELWFGPPPEIWWPGTATCFRAPAAAMNDEASYWRLRKPNLRAAVVTLIALLTGQSANAAPMNPLDWQGPEFLLLYALLAGLSIVFALAYRRWQAGNQRHAPLSQLDTSAIAYLLGGDARLIETVVGDLLLRKAAQFNAETGRTQVLWVPSEFDPHAREIAQQLQQNGDLDTLTARCQPTVRAIRIDLERRGLLHAPERARQVAVLSALAPATVLLFGLAKIAIGVARDRPVLFLVLFAIALAVVCLVLINKRARHTRAGLVAIAELKRRHSRLMRAPRDKEWGLALALAGTAVLSGTAVAAFHDFRHPPGSSSGSSSSDSSTGGSSDSSSDSGDSGGSGCGGCGGGGD